MLNLKHDIKIEIKNEKEVFRFVRLLLFTFIFSMAFLGVSDYIWNMTWYRISTILIPWVVAIPAIANCIARKVKWRELIGNHSAFQIFAGIGIGTVIAIAWIGFECMTQDAPLAQMYPQNIWAIFRILAFYVFVIGPSEELIYRVAIMGNLEELLPQKKWIAPLVSNSLFAMVHLIQNTWENVALAFVIGGIYTVLYYKWEKCGFLMVSVIHGIFDFMLAFLPFVWNKFM